MFVQTLIILLKIVVVVFGFVMALGALLTFVERKQSAWIHNRIGPNRANFGGHIQGEAMLNSIRAGGLIHILADSLKSLLKEDIVPEGVHKTLHTLAPAMALFPAMVIFSVIPWMDYWCVDGMVAVVNYRDICLSETRNYFTIADIDVGFLFVFAIASMEVYAAAIAGWASNSKFSLLGGLRASAQMISYEVSMGLSILGIVLIAGSVNLNEIVRSQGELLFGWIPAWGFLLQPVGFFLFFTAAIAESKRAPFDIPEGESEIVAGFMTEYSSMKFAVFMLADFIAIVFVASMSAVLFFGGWQVPYLYADGFHVPHWSLYLIGGLLTLLFGAYIGRGAAKRKDIVSTITTLVVVITGLIFVVMSFIHDHGVVKLPYLLVVLLRIGSMIFKVLVLSWLQVMIRWTVPRFRYDQVMRLGWKVMLPLAIANLLVTATVVYLV